MPEQIDMKGAAGKRIQEVVENYSYSNPRLLITFTDGTFAVVDAGLGHEGEPVLRTDKTFSVQTWSIEAVETLLGREAAKTETRERFNRELGYKRQKIKRLLSEIEKMERERE